MIAFPERIELDYPENLHLLRFGPDDAEAFRNYVNDNDMLDPNIEDRVMSEWRAAHIVRGRLEAMQREERAPYTIRNAESAIVGEAELYDHRSDFAKIQIGVAEHLRRRGVGRVAAVTLIEQGKQTWGLTRTAALVAPANIPSQKLLQSVGFAYQPGNDYVDLYDTDGRFTMQYWEKQL